MEHPTNRFKFTPAVLFFGLLELNVHAQLTWPTCPDVRDADFGYSIILSNQMDATLIEPLRLKIDATGRVFVSLKRSGEIWMFEPALNHKKTVLGKVPVSYFGFHGLLGMALSPDFIQTGFIYTLTNHRATGSSPIMFRISRVTLKGSALDLTTQKAILEWPTDITEGHTGGDLAFDADGNLLVTTGCDTWARPSQFSHPNSTYKMTGFDDYRTPIDEREPQFNALRSSANTNDLRGKLLRIKPIQVLQSHPQNTWGKDITYSIPSGNLFPTNTPKTRPEIFSMGLRNPYSLHADVSGSIYIADVGPQGTNDILTGPSGGDQLYITNKPANFGFPMFVDGKRPYPIYDFAQERVVGTFDAKKPFNFSKLNNGLDTLPAITAAVTVSHHNNSLNTPGWFVEGSMSLMSGPVYHYDGASASTVKFPPHFDGKWIISDEEQSLLKAVTLNGEQVQKVQRIFAAYAMNNPLDMEFAPDGSLYVLEYSGPWNGSNANTKISRLTYRGNCRPALAISPRAHKKAPSAQSLIVFDGRSLSIPANANKVEIFNVQGDKIYARVLGTNEKTLTLPLHIRMGLLFAHFGE